MGLRSYHGSETFFFGWVIFSMKLLNRIEKWDGGFRFSFSSIRVWWIWMSFPVSLVKFMLVFISINANTLWEGFNSEWKKNGGLSGGNGGLKQKDWFDLIPNVLPSNLPFPPIHLFQSLFLFKEKEEDKHPSIFSCLPYEGINDINLQGLQLNPTMLSFIPVVLFLVSKSRNNQPQIQTLLY